MDPYEFLQISRNPDGSLSRRDIFPILQPDATGAGNPSAVLSKDIHLNPSLNTSLRLFLPSSPTKLPVILFFHAGGFILLNPGTNINHIFCERLAASLPALVVSVKYRLAPEHRLPAAFLDAVDALLCLPTLPDPWLAAHADFSRCFLAGSSAGGNIAYHAALRARGLDLGPTKLSGLILNQPFFGGEERTESELRFGVVGSTLPLAAADLMWELSLPEGADRDHEYCNVAAKKETVKGLPKCLVIGFSGDPLVDRQRELAKKLERGGIEVVVKIEDGGFHGADIMEPGRDMPLFERIGEFVNSVGP